MNMQPEHKPTNPSTASAAPSREAGSELSYGNAQAERGAASYSGAPNKPNTPINQILQMHRTMGNQAVSRMFNKSTPPAKDTIQRATINPAVLFAGARADNNVNAGIAGNELKGFGVQVNGALWHTQLTFNATNTPGIQNGQQMNAEGSGVSGVIGPDHPYGSQPSSPTAAQNNQMAGTIRGMIPHGHVAAHIVNDQLGGPGEDQNLFALPGTANTLMEKKVESKMKAAVEAGSFIYYEASVQHPANGPADSITMSWNKLDNTGADIGGGQSNEVITANTTSNNVAIDALGPGTEATNTSLLHPTDDSAIKWRPWGPFQMPDPKKYIQLLNYLDISAFPAVGNKKAFEEFLKLHNNKQMQMQIFFAFLGSDLSTFTSNLARWIQSKNSGILIKTRRGITNDIINKLLRGTTTEKENAFLDAIQSGDGNTIIANAAGSLATIARNNARGRV